MDPKTRSQRAGSSPGRPPEVAPALGSDHGSPASTAPSHERGGAATTADSDSRLSNGAPWPGSLAGPVLPRGSCEGQPPAGATMDSQQLSLMVLGERLAVMNSIHQSESYTALLSLSVKFCLGGLAELCCSRGRCPAGWALSKRFPEDARYCRTNQWPSSGNPLGHY
ncbi:uncharacterized protein LOC120619700 [Pteropus medius]|nr:uncharacterized protein LOC120619700 [Pteropus giganteus]